MSPEGSQGPAQPPGEDHEFDRELLGELQSFLGSRRDRLEPTRQMVEAWERFYQRFEPMFETVCKHGDYCQLDQDCVQEIWRIIIVVLPDFQYDDRRGQLRDWLMAVARHAWADRWRRPRNPATGSLSPAIAGQLSSRERDPAITYEKGRVRELVREALSHLQSQVSGLSYEVLHRHWIEGQSFAEISEGLGLTPKQVRDRHARMLQKLRHLCEIYGLDGSSPG